MWLQSTSILFPLPESSFTVQASGRPAPISVLVVDDEQIIADTLVAILRHVGYTAQGAYSGARALALAAIAPPHLLISDVVMPAMSGIQLAIAMRTLCPGCKTLLFSGQASTTGLLSSPEVAHHGFTVLNKPIHPTDLLAEISSLTASSLPNRGLSLVSRSTG